MPLSNWTPLWWLLFLEIVLKQARAIADISGKRELIQQLDIDAESIENDEDCFNSDVSLDFHHQWICDYLPVITLYSCILLIM